MSYKDERAELATLRAEFGEAPDERAELDSLRAEFGESQSSTTRGLGGTPVTRGLAQAGEALMGKVGEIPHEPPPVDIRGDRPLSPSEQSFQGMGTLGQLGSQSAFAGANLIGAPVSFAASIPKTIQDVVVPPSGQTRGGVLGEQATGFAQMIKNLPAQAYYGLQYPVRALTGETAHPFDDEYYKQAIESLYQTGGTEPIFAAGMLGSPVMKSRAAAAKLGEVPRKVPTEAPFPPDGPVGPFRPLEQLSAAEKRLQYSRESKVSRERGSAAQEEAYRRKELERTRPAPIVDIQATKAPKGKSVESAIPKQPLPDYIKNTSRTKKTALKALGGGLGAVAVIHGMRDEEAEAQVATIAGLATLISPVKARVGRSVKGASTSIRRGAFQAKNVVKLPESKSIVQDMTTATEKQFHMAGEYTEQMRDAGIHRGVTARVMAKAKGEKRYAGEEISDLLEQRDSRNSNVPIIKKLRVVLDGIREDAKKLGIKVGEVKDYYPRSLKENVAKAIDADIHKVRVIADDLMAKQKFSEADARVKVHLEQASAYTREATANLMKTGKAKTYTHALELLENAAQEELFSAPGFIKRRTEAFPSHFYERDARKVIPRYISTMSKYMAQVEMFGEGGKGLYKRLAEVEKLSTTEWQDLSRIVDIWSGELTRRKGLRGKRKSMADAFVASEYSTKIAGGFATIPNITQPFISALNLGAGNLAKGYLRILSKGGRKQVRRSGAINQSLIYGQFGYEAPGGLLGKLSQVGGEISGFTGINRINANMAALTFESFAKEMHKTANLKSHWMGKNRIKFAQDRLSDFNIDYTKPLTKKILLEKMYRFATDSQLQKNVLNEAMWMNHPAARPFMLFKRFGMRQVAWQTENLTREFKRAYHEAQTEGGGITKSMIKSGYKGGMRTAVPLLRLAAGGYFGGEFVVWAKNNLKSLLSGEDLERTSDPFTLKRFLENVASVGTLGMVSDFADATSVGRQLLWSTTPVAWADYENFTKGNYMRPLGSIANTWRKRFKDKGSNNTQVYQRGSQGGQGSQRGSEPQRGQQGR